MNKYYFIDNERKDLIQPIIDELSSTNTITVEFVEIAKFEELLKKLKNVDFDGIIIDYRLDDKNEQDISFKAPAIAQELRDRVAVAIQEQSAMADFPMILCSTDAKIKSLKRDTTSLDLFDYRFNKENYEKDDVIKKLDSLANGYKTIDSVLKDGTNNISDIIQRDINGIDDKIFARFYGNDLYPSHELARHILQFLIGQTGCLIDEDILAARLGIDKESSDLGEVLEAFNQTKYNGVFSEFETRWWSDLVAEKFEEITLESIVSINAEQKVKLLISKNINGLTAAKPLQYCQSSYFWTICQAKMKPLDPLDGFMLNSEVELLSWHEPKYISLIALLEEEDKQKNLKLHPSEIERSKLEKQEYK